MLNFKKLDIVRTGIYGTPIVVAKMTFNGKVLKIKESNGRQHIISNNIEEAFDIFYKRYKTTSFFN